MRRFGVVALAALLLPATVDAQMSPGARSVAMGGGGMVFATGVDAIEWNPANLNWAGGWSASLYELGVSTLSTGATYKEILAIAGADAFGASDLNVPQIVGAIPAEGLQLSAVTEGFITAIAAEGAEIPKPGSPLPSIGVTVGNVGVRFRSRVMSDFTMSREIADLIGNGFDAGRIQEYSAGNTGWRTTSFSEVIAAYGTTLGGLMSVGVAGRYVIGHSMVTGRFFEPVVDLNTTTLSIETIGVEARGGSGFGLDVGLSLELPNGVRASFSGMNVFQRMNWDETLIAHSTTFTDADFDQLDFIGLLDQFDAQPVDPTSVSLSVIEASEGLFEESYFPQVFRAGVGWRSGRTTLEAVGTKVAPRGRFTSAWDERVSLGVEHALPVLTLRAGLARADEGLTALTGGFGIGLGPLILDTSLGRFSGEEGTVSREGFYGTISLQLRRGGS